MGLNHLKKNPYLSNVLGSEKILISDTCKRASRKIYPLDSDELFNTCWLKFREKELSNVGWSADNPEAYFLVMMRHQVIEWQRQRICVDIDLIELPSINEPEQSSVVDCLDNWLSIDSTDENDMFLKNILILAKSCRNINEACKLTGMSRASFWKYRNLAIEKFYEFTRNTDFNHSLSGSMV